MVIVAAVDKSWGIGLGGTQTLVIPEDRKHFRQVTGSGTVIVGRKTLLDFPGGKPLKNRRNIVLTRDRNFHVPGADTAGSVDEALALIRDEPEDNVFVIGGESVYRALLPYCKRAFLTVIEAQAENDAFFPNLDELPSWSRESRSGSLVSGGMEYYFATYVNSDVRCRNV